MITDALGNEVIPGKWYGYSSLGGGHSHTTLGKVKTAYQTAEKVGKVRFTNCKVKKYVYGKEYDPTWLAEDEKPSDVTIRSSMIFPVPDQE